MAYYIYAFFLIAEEPYIWVEEWLDGANYDKRLNL